MTNIELCPEGYPDAWPKTNPLRPSAVVSVISHAQKKDLYERNTTTRQLALELGVKEAYLSSLFPGKEPARAKMKQSLRAVRKEFRDSYAELVIRKQITLKEAARMSNVSYRTVARAVEALKAQNLPAKPDNIPVVAVREATDVQAPTSI